MVLVLSVGPELTDQEIRLHSPQRQGVQTSVVDVAGLPNGSAVGDLLQWDGSQWILVGSGGNPGDVLTFDGLQWQPAAAPGGQSAWDTIVTALGDLPAPVAGVITLPSGSYAFKNSVALGANTLLVPAGNTCLIKGMGLGKVLSGSAGSVLNVKGEAVVESLAVSASAGVGILQDQAGSMLIASASRVTGGTVGYSITAGASRLVTCELIGGTSNALSASGASVDRVDFENTLIRADAAAAVLWNADDSDLYFMDVELRCTLANGTCFENTGAGTLQFIGGKWSTDIASRGNGLNINGNIQGGLQVIGVHGEDISTSDASGEAFIRYQSGTVRRATVAQCNTSTTVSTAINWPAASIPTNGLSIVGNTWDDPTPYVGFTHASARVNAKANLLQSGLMSETPIVP